MRTSIFRTVTLMMLTVMCIRNYSSAQSFDSGDHFLNINTSRINDDSVEVTTVVCKDGPLYVLQVREGKVLSFSVDGRNVPADSLGRYQQVIDQIKIRVKEAQKQAAVDREQAERDREQAGRDREEADRDRNQAERDRGQAERDRQQALMNRDQANVNRLQAEGQRELAERDRQEADQERRQADRDRDQNSFTRDQAARDREQAVRDRAQAVRDREQAERDRVQAERDRDQAARDRERAEADRRRMDSVVKDLVADGIVPDRYSIHALKMDADEFIVNGKRLPDALEKKYIAKYVTKGFSMSYEHND